MTYPDFTPEELETEEWRDVVAYEGVYSVSNLGRVRRDAPPSRQGGICFVGRIMKPIVTPFGYHRIMLTAFGKRQWRPVHRLVLDAFRGAHPDLFTNHKDGKKTNNRLSNLEWVTHRENMAHAVQTGLYPTGERNGSHRYPERRAGMRNGRHTKPESTCRGEKQHSAKLTEQQVRDIRATPLRCGTQAHLARQYSVSATLISAIIKRKIWTHI